MLETPGGQDRFVCGGIWGPLSVLLRGPFTMLLGLGIPADGRVGHRVLLRVGRTDVAE